MATEAARRATQLTLARPLHDLVRPVIEPVGEARPNAEVFSKLAERLGVGVAEEETDTLLRVVGRFPDAAGYSPAAIL